MDKVNTEKEKHGASEAQLCCHDLLCADIDRYLVQLAPHIKQREAAQLLIRAVGVIREMEIKAEKEGVV